MQQVINIGAPRTGTRSMAVAFTRLGWPVRKVNSVQLQWRFLHGTFEGRYLCQGVTDMPYFSGLGGWWRHFKRDMPEAKFLLTIRNSAEWPASMRRRYERKDRLAKKAEMAASGPADLEAIRFLMMFGWVALPDDATMADSYEEYNRQIVDGFRHEPERLLVMDMSAGFRWEPLCRWLGVPVPDEPFPFIRRGFFGRALKQHERDVSRCG